MTMVKTSWVAGAGEEEVTRNVRRFALEYFKSGFGREAGQAG